LRKTLEKASKDIKRHEAHFFQAIDQADREAVTSRDIQTSQALGAITASLGLHPRRQLSLPASPLSPGNKQDELLARATTIPGRPNPSFVARIKEIEDIHQYFASNGSSRGAGPACLVIHGLGGQGKTQTALAYYWKYRESYDATFLINSETAEQLEASYLAIAKKLRQTNLLTSSPSPSPDAEVSWEIERAREWLEGTSGSTNLNLIYALEIFLTIGEQTKGGCLYSTISKTQG
jgi:hypothetical protein